MQIQKMRILYKGMQNPNKEFLIVGTDEEATEIQAELNGQGIAPQVRVLSPEVLPESLSEVDNVGAVCCASAAVKLADVATLEAFCRERDVELFFCVPELSVLQKNMRVRNVGFLSFLSLVSEPLSHWWNRMTKRLFDLLLSGLFLLIFFPLIYIAAAIVIKRKSSGPVFSFAKEAGKRGMRFERISFRTADLPAESFLQKKQIRQLPQFLNVFGGSMSIVGLRFVKETGDALPSTYNYGKPGMLNCRGCKDADVWYMQNWSLWLDVKILVKAIFDKN